ncbi:hypothetical protein EN802_31895 [bacterium M00.F.Ca.ET.159.01.1.1]|uniref:hypothetical protein n=1 Tax=Mesorhizobium sp. M2D.F.Ca.ET.223.01.1.1 TaxID=2563940 RepID=UPI001093019B|nr:hypothetical protein [Mesorhizobium sp. M2D.F.Ca.ET.223.01.1.1]TGT65286.1 hypothetical protein EN802_31895 [bacterium M00.F.Ca.ET.159.01.1.1]TGT79397.1 hypothetical protein EN800_31235 [bacterium M00.F.Ca.ET.157.01.1.1]
MDKAHNRPQRTREGEWYFQRDEWVRALDKRIDLPIMARFVGGYIAMHINRIDREMWHQQATMAKELGLSAQSVKMAIRALVKAELVVVEKGRRGVRKRAVNRYRINAPWFL